MLQHDWPTAVAVVVVVAGSVVGGVVLSLVFTRIRRLYFAMGTLAFTLFAQTLSGSSPTCTGGENGILGYRSS